MAEPDKKPLVGFFPAFDCIGDTYPFIKIAKCYNKLGGKVVFFSHGGEYEYLAKELGFKIIRIKPIVENPTTYFGNLQHSEEELIRIVKNEIKAYEEAGISLLVQPNVSFGCIISSRVAKISLIAIISGTRLPTYYKANYATFPDIFENIFTRFIPKYIKNRVINWATLNYKGSNVKKINQIFKKFNTDFRLRRGNDIILGDYTLICDDIEFLGIKPTKEFPAKNFIGPISSDDLFEEQSKQIDMDIKKHLGRPGKSILITMGSTGDKELFLKILELLNQTEYNIIALYTNIIAEDECPTLNSNILLKKFVPSVAKLNKMVDLAIIHGGRGTVYTAAYSGKPAIGIPRDLDEQQYNLDCLVRSGMAIRFSKKYFKEKDFYSAIEKIFDSYETYLKNAENLAKKLPRPKGDKNAANRILEFISQTT